MGFGSFPRNRPAFLRCFRSFSNRLRPARSFAVLQQNARCAFLNFCFECFGCALPCPAPLCIKTPAALFRSRQTAASRFPTPASPQAAVQPTARRCFSSSKNFSNRNSRAPPRFSFLQKRLLSPLQILSKIPVAAQVGRVALFPKIVSCAVSCYHTVKLCFYSLPLHLSYCFTLFCLYGKGKSWN